MISNLIFSYQEIFQVVSILAVKTPTYSTSNVNCHGAFTFFHSLLFHICLAEPFC